MQSSPALSLLFAALICAGDVAAAPKISHTSTSAEVCPGSGTIPVDFGEAVTPSSFRRANGMEVKLSGVVGPGEDGETLPAETSMIARRALAAALAGHRLSMVATGTPDRYRRIPAQLFGDGVWIQALMVRQGWLRVSADQQPGACATPLIAAEHQAIA